MILFRQQKNEARKRRGLPPTSIAPLTTCSAERTSNSLGVNIHRIGTDSYNKHKKKIAIIGAGVSGIVSGSVLKEDSHSVTIFEKSDSVGGIWIDTYPEARLQNTWWQYDHPDFPATEPAESNCSSSIPNLHPTALYIRSYFQSCSDHFGLNVKLNTSVVDMNECIDGWNITYEILEAPQSKNEEDHEATTKVTEQFDFVIIAQGHYNYDSPIPWNGVDDFEHGGGTILQRNQIHDLELLKNKKVVVVGFGKTAVDMCTFSVEHGATSTTHIFRSARTLVPMYIMGIHITWLLFNRCNNCLIPCWGHPNRLWSFLHETFPALFLAIWWLIQQIAWLTQTRCAWFAPWEIRNRLKLLKSKSHILEDHRASIALCPPNFFPYISQGKIIPIQGNIQKLTSKGVLLSSGQVVEADIILACIGKGSHVDTFPYLPRKYQEVIQKQKYQNHGLQLYRHILSPDIPNVAFMG